MTVRRPHWLPGFLLAAGLAIGAVTAGCASGDGTASAVEGVSIERTTTIPPAPHLSTTSAVPVELLPPAQVSRSGPPPARSWEGQKYDFGIVERVEQRRGEWVVVFDREQLRNDRGVRSGPTLTEEPVVIGDLGDVRIDNSSRQLRTFGVADGATVLRLSSTWTCAQPMPVWDHLSILDLARTGPGDDVRAALSFDADGQVTQIRLSRGC
jgi:hypothetical protein